LNRAAATDEPLAELTRHQSLLVGAIAQHTKLVHCIALDENWIED